MGNWKFSCFVIYTTPDASPQTHDTIPLALAWGWRAFAEGILQTFQPVIIPILSFPTGSSSPSGLCRVERVASEQREGSCSWASFAPPVAPLLDWLGAEELTECLG